MSYPVTPPTKDDLGPVENCSTMVFFADESIPVHVKLQKALKAGLALPGWLVEEARKQYREGRLQKPWLRYHVTPYFYDPRMIPVPGYPKWEFNPSYPREYPRLIKKRVTLLYNGTVRKEKLPERRWRLMKFWQRRAKLGTHFHTLRNQKNKMRRLRNQKKNEKKVQTKKPSLAVWTGDNARVYHVSEEEDSQDEDVQVIFEEGSHVPVHSTIRIQLPTFRDFIRANSHDPRVKENGLREFIKLWLERGCEWIPEVVQEIMCYKEWFWLPKLEEEDMDPWLLKRYRFRKRRMQKRHDAWEKKNTGSRKNVGRAEIMRWARDCQEWKKEMERAVHKVRGTAECLLYTQMVEANWQEFIARAWKRHPLNYVSRHDKEIFQANGKSLLPLVAKMNEQFHFREELRQCKECIDDMIQQVSCQEIISQLVSVKEVVREQMWDKPTTVPELDYLHPQNEKDLMRELTEIHAIRKRKACISKTSWNMFALLKVNDCYWTVPLRSFMSMYKAETTVPRSDVLRKFKPDLRCPIEVFKVFLTTNMDVEGRTKIGSDVFEYHTLKEIEKLYHEELARKERMLKDSRNRTYYSDVLQKQVNNPYCSFHISKRIDKHILEKNLLEFVKPSAGYFWRTKPFSMFDLPLTREEEKNLEVERRKRIEDIEEARKKTDVEQCKKEYIRERQGPLKLSDILNFPVNIYPMIQIPYEDEKKPTMAQTKYVLYMLDRLDKTVFDCAVEKQKERMRLLSMADPEKLDELFNARIEKGRIERLTRIGPLEKKERALGLEDDPGASTSNYESSRLLTHFYSTAGMEKPRDVEWELLMEYEKETKKMEEIEKKKKRERMHELRKMELKKITETSVRKVMKRAVVEHVREVEEGADESDDSVVDDEERELLEKGFVLLPEDYFEKERSRSNVPPDDKQTTVAEANSSKENQKDSAVVTEETPVQNGKVFYSREDLFYGTVGWDDLCPMSPSAVVVSDDSDDSEDEQERTERAAALRGISPERKQNLEEQETNYNEFLLNEKEQKDKDVANRIGEGPEQSEQRESPELRHEHFDNDGGVVSDGAVQQESSSVAKQIDVVTLEDEDEVDDDCIIIDARIVKREIKQEIEDEDAEVLEEQEQHESPELCHDISDNAGGVVSEGVAQQESVARQIDVVTLEDEDDDCVIIDAKVVKKEIKQEIEDEDAEVLEELERREQQERQEQQEREEQQKLERERQLLERKQRRDARILAKIIREEEEKMARWRPFICSRDDPDYHAKYRAYLDEMYPDTDGPRNDDDCYSDNEAFVPDAVLEGSEGNSNRAESVELFEQHHSDVRIFRKEQSSEDSPSRSVDIPMGSPVGSRYSAQPMPEQFVKIGERDDQSPSGASPNPSLNSSVVLLGDLQDEPCIHPDLEKVKEEPASPAALSPEPVAINETIEMRGQTKSVTPEQVIVKTEPISPARSPSLMHSGTRTDDLPANRHYSPTTFEQVSATIVIRRRHSTKSNGPLEQSGFSEPVSSAVHISQNGEYELRKVKQEVESPVGSPAPNVAQLLESEVESDEEHPANITHIRIGSSEQEDNVLVEPERHPADEYVSPRLRAILDGFWSPSPSPYSDEEEDFYAFPDFNLPDKSEKQPEDPIAKRNGCVAQKDVCEQENRVIKEEPVSPSVSPIPTAPQFTREEREFSYMSDRSYTASPIERPEKKQHRPKVIRDVWADDSFDEDELLGVGEDVPVTYNEDYLLSDCHEPASANNNLNVIKDEDADAPSSRPPSADSVIILEPTPKNVATCSVVENIKEEPISPDATFLAPEGHEPSVEIILSSGVAEQEPADSEALIASEIHAAPKEHVIAEVYDSSTDEASEVNVENIKEEPISPEDTILAPEGHEPSVEIILSSGVAEQEPAGSEAHFASEIHAAPKENAIPEVYDPPTVEASEVNVENIKEEPTSPEDTILAPEGHESSVEIVFASEVEEQVFSGSQAIAVPKEHVIAGVSVSPQIDPLTLEASEVAVENIDQETISPDTSVLAPEVHEPSVEVIIAPNVSFASDVADDAEVEQEVPDALLESGEDVPVTYDEAYLLSDDHEPAVFSEDLVISGDVQPEVVTDPEDQDVPNVATASEDTNIVKTPVVSEEYAVSLDNLVAQKTVGTPEVAATPDVLTTPNINNASEELSSSEVPIEQEDNVASEHISNLDFVEAVEQPATPRVIPDSEISVAQEAFAPDIPVESTTSAAPEVQVSPVTPASCRRRKQAVVKKKDVDAINKALDREWRGYSIEPTQQTSHAESDAPLVSNDVSASAKEPVPATLTPSQLAQQTTVKQKEIESAPEPEQELEPVQEPEPGVLLTPRKEPPEKKTKIAVLGEDEPEPTITKRVLRSAVKKTPTKESKGRKAKKTLSTPKGRIQRRRGAKPQDVAEEQDAASEVEEEEDTEEPHVNEQQVERAPELQPQENYGPIDQIEGAITVGDDVFQEFHNEEDLLAEPIANAEDRLNNIEPEQQFTAEQLLEDDSCAGEPLPEPVTGAEEQLKPTEELVEQEPVVVEQVVEKKKRGRPKKPVRGAKKKKTVTAEEPQEAQALEPEVEEPLKEVPEEEALETPTKRVLRKRGIDTTISPTSAVNAKSAKKNKRAVVGGELEQEHAQEPKDAEGEPKKRVLRPRGLETTLLSTETENAKRRKRIYLSKNNPAPRVRAAEVEDEAVRVPVRLTGVAVASGSETPESSPERDLFPMLRLLEEPAREDNPQPVAEQIEREVKQEEPDENWVIPPPVKEFYRKSRKRARQEALEKDIKQEDGVPADPDCEVVMATIAQMKQEQDEAMEECMIVQANYKCPQAHVAVDEEPELGLPKVTEHPGEGMKHLHLVLKKTWGGINELFMSDPAKFSKFCLILSKDSDKKGRVFKSNASVVDRTSEFSPEFIDYMANSPRYLSAENQPLCDYKNFSEALRKRTSILLANHKITPLKLYQFVEKITAIKKAIRDNCRNGMMGDNERDATAAAEAILLGRYIDSVMTLTALSQLRWATEVHVKRRLELIYHGWEMFLASGGFFKVMLALNRDDVKPINARFRKYSEEYLKDIETNYAKAVELYKMTDEELFEKLRTRAGVTESQVEAADADVRGEESETHKEKCLRCALSNTPIYFSSFDNIETHEKFHETDLKECGHCFEDFIEPELVIHQLNVHTGL